MKTFSVYSIHDYDSICTYILTEYKNKIFLLNGELGSGKTTFVQFFCKKIGVQDKILSPTFNLVNEYSNQVDKSSIYHFDLYRLKDIKELIDIDFIELIDSGGYCFIEWPEICEHLIIDNFIKLNFKIISESEREIEII